MLVTSRVRLSGGAADRRLRPERSASCHTYVAAGTPRKVQPTPCVDIRASG
jgi:hypothetical protein